MAKKESKESIGIRFDLPSEVRFTPRPLSLRLADNRAAGRAPGKRLPCVGTGTAASPPLPSLECRPRFSADDGFALSFFADDFLLFSFRALDFFEEPFGSLRSASGDGDASASVP